MRAPALKLSCKLAASSPSGVPIVALTTGQTGPVTLLDRAATQLHLLNVTTFPLLDRLCRPEVFVNSVTEQMAKALHGKYLRHRRLDGTFDPGRESHKQWEVLKETFRESNRDAATHLSERLDKAGYSVQVSDDWAVALPVFSEKEVNDLAESEHQRWCEERPRGRMDSCRGDRPPAKAPHRPCSVERAGRVQTGVGS